MGIGKQLSTFQAEEFSGGCNYRPDITELKPNESPNAINVVFDRETVYKRTGYEKLNATSAGTNDYGYGLFDFGIEGTGRLLVAHFDDAVYKMANLDGTLTSIRTSAPAVKSYSAKVKTSLIQCYENYSAEYYWDGTSSTMAVLSASAPGFKYPIEFQGYLLGGSISSSRLRIYYEDINTMIGGAYADFFTLPGGRDDSMTGWFILNGRLYATTKTAIHRISFIGGAAVFDDKEVVSTTGAVPRTARVIVTNDFGEVCLFLGYDKNLYLFDGSVVRVVSEKFRYANNETPIALDLLDDTYIEESHAVYDTIRQVYRLCITKKGETLNNYALNIDARTLAYYPFDNMTFLSSEIARDNVGRRYLIGANYAGHLMKMFINSNHDDGEVIIENYEGAPIIFGASRVYKNQDLGLYFNPVANYELILEDRTDFDKTWKSRDTLPMRDVKDRFLGVSDVLGNTAYLGSEVEVLRHAVRIPVTQNVYRFRLRSGGTSGLQCSYTTGTVAGAGGGTSVTGTGTVWTSDMTSVNGWKIWVKTGTHLNYVYNFTYVSATSATVSTMQGTSPANDFTGASYEVFRTGHAACGLGWELLKVELSGQPLTVGRAESLR